MDHFGYRSGVMCAEGVPIPKIADRVGTPFYCYSTATLRRHYRVFAEAFAGQDALIAYSLKANSNQAVIATLAALGAGADVVSEGELRRALAVGADVRQTRCLRVCFIVRPHFADDVMAVVTSVSIAVQRPNTGRRGGQTETEFGHQGTPKSPHF